MTLNFYYKPLAGMSTELHPFVCFLGILFLLMVVGSVGGLALKEHYRPYTNFTFVPRWQQEEMGVPEWSPEPRPVPPQEFAHHIPITGSQSYEVSGTNKSFLSRAVEYVTYLSEGFQDGDSNYLAGNVNTEEKNASLFAESAGKGGDIKMSSPVAGDPLTNFPPNKPSPVDFGTRSNYMLLSDELEPLDSGISCVNSRSCYAVDTDRLQEKTGNYRQLTNNYKRGYPDSCSSPYQELVLSFYKDDGLKIDVPKNCM